MFGSRGDSHDHPMTEAFHSLSRLDVCDSEDGVFSTAALRNRLSSAGAPRHFQQVRA
jgi:hypothetical protein